LRLIADYLESYGLLYAFTLLWQVLAVLVLGMTPAYSYTPAYLAISVAAPFLGMGCVLTLTEPGWRPPRLLAATLLLGVLSLVASVGIVFVAALSIVPTIDLVQRVGFATTARFAAAAVVVASLPALVTLLRGTWLSKGLRGWLQAIGLTAALALVAASVVYSLSPGDVLGALLRKDQLTALFGPLSWQVPAYAAAGAFALLLDIAGVLPDTRKAPESETPGESGL
jgi:hypothetical protein